MMALFLELRPSAPKARTNCSNYHKLFFRTQNQDGITCLGFFIASSNLKEILTDLLPGFYTFEALLQVAYFSKVISFKGLESGSNSNQLNQKPRETKKQKP